MAKREITITLIDTSGNEVIISKESIQNTRRELQIEISQNITALKAIVNNVREDNVDDSGTAVMSFVKTITNLLHEISLIDHMTFRKGVKSIGGIVGRYGMLVRNIRGEEDPFESIPCIDIEDEEMLMRPPMRIEEESFNLKRMFKVLFKRKNKNG